MKITNCTRLLVILVILIALTGCNGISSGYNLNCDIDAEQYTITIDGEEGPVQITSNGEKTTTFYAPDGKATSIEVQIDRVLNFEESGNQYNIAGNINVDFASDQAVYNITATSDAFSEPQTCSNQ